MRNLLSVLLISLFMFSCTKDGGDYSLNGTVWESESIMSTTITYSFNKKTVLIEVDTKGIDKESGTFNYSYKHPIITTKKSEGYYKVDDDLQTMTYIDKDGNKGGVLYRK